MELSNNLISQLVKATKDSDKRNTETTVYGTAKVYGNNNKTYVKLDGSDLLTPVSNITNVKDGERVTVMIKDHTATVTGNITSPSARTGDVEDMGEQVLLQVDELYADKAVIGELEAEFAEIEKLVADKATIGQLEAEIAEIDKLIAGKVDADELEAELAFIDTIYARKAEIESLDAKYANIDFANVSEADIDKLLARSAIIEEVTSADGTFTRNLTAVTINGDYIEVNNLKADSIVIKGEDGLYYKLNVEGGATTSELVTEEDLQNGLSGTIIVANSITADKISVTDLVAFGATIGGFRITDTSIYSGTKGSAVNTTRGVYLDSEGQFAAGDKDNYIRYYKAEDGSHKLEVSADSMIFSSSKKTVEEAIEEAADIEVGARNLIRNSTNLIFEDYFFTSTDNDNAVLGSAVLGLAILNKEG